jgi:transcriptional regulator with XRE-family HTH domain
MNYQTLPFAEDLLRARTAKGWSQRELSAKANVPQAQISRIERGVVDLRLSTFLELARLLDLEVTLVPRNATSAVQAIIREAETTYDLRTVRGAITVLHQVGRLIRVENDDVPLMQRLKTLTQEIELYAPNIQSSASRTELAEIAAKLQSEAEHGPNRVRLDQFVNRLAQFRNRLVPLPDAVRPAYTLDDED